MAFSDVINKAKMHGENPAESLIKEWGTKHSTLQASTLKVGQYLVSVAKEAGAEAYHPFHEERLQHLTTPMVIVTRVLKHPFLYTDSSIGTAYSLYEFNFYGAFVDDDGHITEAMFGASGFREASRLEIVDMSPDLEAFRKAAISPPNYKVGDALTWQSDAAKAGTKTPARHGTCYVVETLYHLDTVNNLDSIEFVGFGKQEINCMNNLLDPKYLVRCGLRAAGHSESRFFLFDTRRLIPV